MTGMAERRRQSQHFTLEDAVSLLQQAGFAITPPDLRHDASKRSDAPQALGFTHAQEAVKPTKLRRDRQIHTINLTFHHSVNGRDFGPGKVEVHSPELLSHLLSQDARAIAQENAVFDPTPKSYLIVQKRTPSGNIGPVNIAMQGFELTQIEHIPPYGEYSQGDR